MRATLVDKLSDELRNKTLIILYTNINKILYILILFFFPIQEIKNLRIDIIILHWSKLFNCTKSYIVSTLHFLIG